MNTCQVTIEEMEITRQDLYTEYIAAIGTDQEKPILKKLDLMDEIIDAMLGYEQTEEDQDEWLNTSTNWDEWALDMRIDEMREEAAV